jgi:hypothetical protein
MTSPAFHIPMPGFTASPATTRTGHFTTRATARFNAGQATACETTDTALERTQVRNGPASSFGLVFSDPSFKTPADLARAAAGRGCRLYTSRVQAAGAQFAVQKRMVKPFDPEKTDPRPGSFPTFRNATLRRQRHLPGNCPAGGHATLWAPARAKTTARPASEREGT